MFCDSAESQNDRIALTLSAQPLPHMKKTAHRPIYLKALLLILRPFAGAIRYGALKLMKRMRRPGDKRPIIATSEHLLNEIIIPSVFRAFSDPIFREHASFKALSREEHDRIFNELQVAGIYSAMVHLNTAKSAVRSEDYHFWQEVEEHLPLQFQKILMGYGVDGSNAKLMRKLIDLRGTEYAELQTHILDANNEAGKEFKTLSSNMKRIASAMQAIAIGTADHIRRGKIKEGDPLIRNLTTWLIFLQGKFRKFVRHL